MTTEDAPRWLTADQQRVWRAYLDMTTRLSGRLNREMQEQDGISLADFAVLVTLSEHDGDLRARELGLALDWEKSRLSHQLARMQRRGLVERRNCDSDRRAAMVALTPAGRRTVEAAAPAHAAAVRRYLFDHLAPDQLAALGAVADGVVARLGPPDADCCGADAGATGDGATGDGCG